MRGKGRGARDLRYGRRGGGWLPEGHDPTAPKPKIEKVVNEDDEKRKRRQRTELAEYERVYDLVPGSSTHRGDGTGGGPTGGQSWEGRARMAIARRLAGLPLGDADREALERHPSPRSGVTGEPGWAS